MTPRRGSDPQRRYPHSPWSQAMWLRAVLQVGFDAGETSSTSRRPIRRCAFPYRIVLEQQPSQPVWLADPATADHLLGEAIFGRDRGNDRIIYRREVMP